MQPRRRDDTTTDAKGEGKIFPAGAVGVGPSHLLWGRGVKREKEGRSGVGKPTLFDTNRHKPTWRRRRNDGRTREERFALVDIRLRRMLTWVQVSLWVGRPCYG